MQTSDAYPLLDQLYKERVISVKKIKSETSEQPVFRIRERCDRYFEVELSKVELLALAKELEHMANFDEIVKEQ